MRRARTVIVPPGGLNEIGVVEKIAEDAHQPLFTAAHIERRAGPADAARKIEREERRIGAGRIAIDRDQRRQHRAQRHDRALVARHFRIEPRGIGDIGDQPVKALGVLQHQPQQLLLLFRIVDAQRRLDRAAQRGKRIFQLMRDIGGEMLDRIHAAPDRLGHLAHRDGEIADLIPARGEIGDLRRGAGRCACDPRPRRAAATGRTMVPAR